MAKEDAWLDPARNVVVSVRGVEPGLVTAVKKLEQRLGRSLIGIDLVDKKAINNKYRIKDETGLFKEIICDFDDAVELQQVLKPYIDTALVATCRLEEAIKDFRRAMCYLPYISTSSEASLTWCTQKRLMRDKMWAYDSKLVPKYKSLASYDPTSLSTDLEDFEFPVIVKPNGLYASMLVTRCNDRQELEACLERTLEVIDEVYSQSDGTGAPSVLVEEMMQGDMYSVDAYLGPTGAFYCLPPVHVITSHAMGLPGFAGYLSTLPSGLSEEQLAAAYEAAHAAVRALNLRSTTAHIEMFLTESGWKIIELGPRIGGCREDMYREVYGVDHHYNDLLVRLGLEPEMPMAVLKHVAAVTVSATEEGIITEIDGVEEALQLPSIVKSGLEVKVGDRAVLAGNGGEPFVEAILSNTDPEKLLADAARLRELIKVKVIDNEVSLYETLPST
ncbi:MAG TPA: ATP-grasp domain-containing protein [Candidatus Saccharimonadales bacterium]|nr:ATP-grasp domain-containing protein [Candidatus Saccharimonadales bacterium]